MIVISLSPQMRFSLFQFTLMSVSRCMLVRSPFRVLNRHAVSASLVGYLLLCVVMFVLPFWLCDDPHLAYKAILLFRIGGYCSFKLKSGKCLS